MASILLSIIIGIIYQFSWNFMSLQNKPYPREAFIKDLLQFYIRIVFIYLFLSQLEKPKKYKSQIFLRLYKFCQGENYEREKHNFWVGDYIFSF